MPETLQTNPICAVKVARVAVAHLRATPVPRMVKMILPQEDQEGLSVIQIVQETQYVLFNLFLVGQKGYT